MVLCINFELSILCLAVNLSFVIPIHDFLYGHFSKLFRETNRGREIEKFW